MAKNEALAEALALAEEASKAKTTFLSSMSHEIRTPMNAIIGLDTLALHDETLSPQTREYLEKIGGSARHLLALINDILDMSRIESGRLILRKEEFSFSAMLEQINTMVMSQCGDKGLHYECRLLSPVDDSYIGDDMKLKEVILNILSNAIKFTDAPGSVTLTIERTAVFEEQSTLRFRIKDTGIGMDKEFIPKIFEAFTQENSSAANKYGSTGLGMAITKNIVEMMNGTISVESEKGVGTEFTVAVTLRNVHRQAPEGESAIDPSRLRVLIVDDEEIPAEHSRMVLEEAGIRADVCLSGDEALRMLEVRHTKQEPYNLVLLDWIMPDKDGLATAKQIRALYSNETTIIILTAYNWDEIVEEALGAGVDSFLAKPLFASSVIAEFERIAHRSSMSLFREKKRAERAFPSLRHPPHDRVPVLLQPPVPFPIVGKDPEDLGVEALRMVQLLSVTQLVHHDAVDHLRRRQHQEAVEIQIPPGAAAAPSGPLVSDGDPSVGHADNGGVMRCARRNDPPRLLRQGAELVRGELFDRGPPADPLLVFPDPGLPASYRCFDLGVRGKTGRPYGQTLGAQLQRDRFPVGADDFVGGKLHCFHPPCGLFGNMIRTAFRQPQGMAPASPAMEDRSSPAGFPGRSDQRQHAVLFYYEAAGKAMPG